MKQLNLGKFYTSKSLVNENGLFVKKSYMKGDFIDYIKGPTEYIREFPQSKLEQIINWIGATRHTWINTDESPFRFINHSCDPNVAVTTKRKVIAIKNIPADSEITMDYAFTEGDPDWEIVPCECKSRNCRGKITGISRVPKSVFKKYEPYISKAFRSIYHTK